MNEMVEQDREQLLPIVVATVELFKKTGGEAWRIQALEFGKEAPTEFYFLDRIGRFKESWRVGLFKLPPTEDILVFEWTRRDVERFVGIIEAWLEKTRPRRELLWKLFIEARGAFSKKEENKSSCLGCSEGRSEDWIEKKYYVLGREVTFSEYKWLKDRSGEIVVPKGYVRVTNDTNDLMTVPEMPGRKDILVVVGKKGSYRGTPFYGEWFHGHPSACGFSMYDRKITEIILNGERVSNLDLGLWKDPKKIAERALREAGIEASWKRVEALVEIYKKYL